MKRAHITIGAAFLIFYFWEMCGKEAPEGSDMEMMLNAWVSSATVYQPAWRAHAAEVCHLLGVGMKVDLDLIRSVEGSLQDVEPKAVSWRKEMLGGAAG